MPTTRVIHKLFITRCGILLFMLMSIFGAFITFDALRKPQSFTAPLEDSATHSFLRTDEVSNNVVKSSQRTLRILSWTKRNNYKTEWFEKGQETFQKCKLPPGAICEYTSDKQLFNTSDAILINVHRNEAMPLYKLPHQKWIFWVNEPPPNIVKNFNYSKYGKMFNLTSTYTLSSDVPVPYLHKCHLQSHSKGLAQIASKNFSKIIQDKQKTVAWFVSRCHSKSKREKYVQELQKYIPVDVYGKCGPYTCPKEESNMCYHQVLQPYKFYLSFENSLCKEYVTEKVFNIYPKLDIVPVVLGAADYEKLLPEGTYINVKDFRSPAHLAEYLNFLDKDNNAYEEYLKRKASTKCSYAAPSYPCSLCAWLHQRHGQMDKVDDVYKFWSEEYTCIKPNQYYQDTSFLNASGVGQ